ncbi:MAG: (2Fe-2S)-binding protein [Rhodospirillaceae bacterium]|jgi:2-furoyl-CoA dehydrogenase 2Fe-2S iron sulfur subunit|nr:(2Fe-2S)-binding protein [Rhodospirillaceae bacterium]MBT3492578.1 (2Fe-2S)-binding protein [Rhodospirillaceae bacterium]MBT3782447.1 (2Fe-2S)-binding protein [Rhodospirillaceae bacterium]MBT3978970.1 (2Fe-2S)-binding protein [Rhodospirillaceae bacterium]MBT4167377.1 (2Fe-2S)-binding protein [Rhodospirillaceae bacterium]
MRYLKAGTRHTVRFVLNGREAEGEAEPRLLLSDFLRHQLGAFGTHVGCEHGSCGACTVRVDGKAVRSCLMYAAQVEGREVSTVESLATSDGLNELQAALQKHHGLQCGYCTPGILMSLSQLREEEPDADEARIRDVLSGHICRCTGYHGIVQAALEVFGKD